MHDAIISGPTLFWALFLTAALTFSIGAAGGYFAARTRLSKIGFYILQLKNVRRASFKKQKLMNFSEFRVFHAIELDAAIKRLGYRVVAQPSLGEILDTPRKNARHDNAYRAINSKRVDILIIDKGGWPLLAIEYQGEGHYDSTSVLRDDIKRTALHKAGVGYLEVFPDFSNDKIISAIHERLGLNLAMPNTARDLRNAVGIGADKFAM
jgi:hypothetical protein